MTDLSRPDILREIEPYVDVLHVKIEKQINLASDLKSVLRIARLLSQARFDAVISVTPKAGLLTALVAWFLRVPMRVHWFTGQVWAARTGFSRLILKLADFLIIRLSVIVLADSKQQARFLDGEGLLRNKPCQVVLNGSISGVDTRRFRPNKKVRGKIRSELHLSSSDVVFAFVGRVTKDKGVFDLANALSKLQTKSRTASIWVGKDEENLAVSLQAILSESNHSSFFLGQVKNVEDYLSAADVLVLPSYREGFGTSVIEAAASGIPAIVSDIYGLEDAVVPGVTALAFPAGDVAMLGDCLAALADQETVRQSMGRAARIRARQEFEQREVLRELEKLLLDACATISSGRVRAKNGR